VGVITGAGVSAESGIPTYRGAGGVYDDGERGAERMAALSGVALAADPDATWRAIADLVKHLEGAQPNDAHRAIVAIERAVARFVLLTQNVDGLHQRAGSREVIDIHGTAAEIYCVDCSGAGALPDLRSLHRAPRCERCGGVMRPDVVLFGELLPEAKVDRLRQAFFVEPPDLVLIAGTSALFPYIAEPVRVARLAGRLTVEVNTEPTVVSGLVDHALRGPAARWLPLIAEALGAR
jgi:NAD-dependent deacetylase